MRNTLLLAMIVAWSMAGVARAQSAADMARANELQEQAAAFTRTGDVHAANGELMQARREYGRAVTAYIEGFVLSKRPSFLFHLATVYRMRGDKTWAIRCYDAFLRVYPGNDQRRDETVQALAELKYDMAHGHKDGFLDPALDPSAVCIAEPEPEPEPEEKQELVEEPVIVNPELTPIDRSFYRTGFWVSSGVVLVGITGATLSFLSMRALEDEKTQMLIELEESGVFLDEGNACEDAVNQGKRELADLCNRGASRATLANVFHGVTVIGAVAAGYFLYKGYLTKAGGQESRPGTARILPVLTPAAVGAQLTLQF